MKKSLILIFSISIFIVLILGGFWFYNSIYKYAYYSYLSGCNIVSDEQLQQQGLVKLGQFNVETIENITTTTIQVAYCNETIDMVAYQHELCHQKQYEQHRLYNCSFPVGVMTNELECYIKQKF